MIMMGYTEHIEKENKKGRLLKMVDLDKMPDYTDKQEKLYEAVGKILLNRNISDEETDRISKDYKTLLDNVYNAEIKVLM